jgi:chitinase
MLMLDGAVRVRGALRRLRSQASRHNDVSYSNIMQYYYEASAHHWDDIAKASYLSWSTPKQIQVPASRTKISTTYTTYEDETSITQKGAYVKSQGLGGVIIWTISQGYLGWMTTGEKDPLMKATKAALL